MRRTISAEPASHCTDEVGPLTEPRGGKSVVGPVEGTVAVLADKIGDRTYWVWSGHEWRPNSQIRLVFVRFSQLSSA